MSYTKVLPCSKRFCHDWLACAFSHPGESASRRDPKRFAHTGVACADKKAGQCARGNCCPYSHNLFEYWLHPTRYRTQLCTDAAQCNRHICFFAHSAAELREPTRECELPEDVRSVAELAVNAEEARQNMVDDGRGPSAAKAFAVGKAVALALMDRPAQQQCRQQVPINPAQNRLLADVVADDLLSSLLADLHARQHQQPQLQASSSRPIADAKRADWTASQSQPRRDRPLSLELGAAERQELALRSLSDAAADPRYGGRFSSKLVRETLKAQGGGLNARPGDNMPMSIPHPLLSPPFSNNAMLAFESALYGTNQGELPQHRPAIWQNSAETHRGHDHEGSWQTDANSSERRAGLDRYMPLTKEEWVQLATSTHSADVRLSERQLGNAEALSSCNDSHMFNTPAAPRFTSNFHQPSATGRFPSGELHGLIPGFGHGLGLQSLPEDGS